MPTVIRALSKYGIVLALILEIGLFAVLSKRFFEVSNLINIVNQVAIYGIIGVGMTFVILTAGIDLSIGSVVALVGVITAGTLKSGYLPEGCVVPGAVALGLLIGACSGFTVGAVVTLFGVSPFIATLAMMTVLRGFTYIYSGGLSVGELPEAFRFIGRGRLLGEPGLLPVPVLVMAVVMIAGYIILTHTRFGRYIYAIGGNELASHLSGIAVNRVKLAVYVISGSLSALSGVVLASRLGAGDPNSGIMYEMQVIAAVVVGGTSLFGGVGTILGTFIGTMIIGVLYNGLNLTGVSSYWQQVVLGAVILVAVLMDQLKKLRTRA